MKYFEDEAKNRHASVPLATMILLKYNCKAKPS
jgi:hypothetical protein